MNRHLIAAAALAAAMLVPATVHASGGPIQDVPRTGTLPAATPFTVNAGPGDQTDPHAFGHYVTYASEMSGDSEVRVHDLRAGTDAGIPVDGGLDFLSDVSSAGVTYTHLTTDAEIRLYDPASGAVTTLTGQSANTRESRGGGTTVVWQDFGYTNDVTTPELTVYDTATGTTSRLTNDLMLDKDPAVSPDGNIIVWTKCRTDGTGCAIWEADRNGGTWSQHALTSAAEGEAALPDTDGHVVVYSVVANGDENVYWQPVGGGTAHELTLPGQQTNPNVSGGVVTYEQLDMTTQVPNYDVYAYDIATNTVYRLTSSPEDETLNDVTVDGRFATVVWTKSEADDNVYGEAFTLPALPARLALTGGAQPTVTAMVSDAAGDPVPGTTVRFATSGAVTADGSCITGDDGTCAFAYGSSPPEGSVVVTAYADTNLDGMQDGDEPSATVTQTFQSDTTPPTVSVDGFADGQEILLGSPAPTVTCSSGDTGSGIASTTGPTEQSSLTENGVGTVSYTCTATDRAGNTASDTKSYRVVYDVDDLLPSAAVNQGHSGRAYPLAWQLKDASGGYVGSLSAVASIRYRAASCTTFSPDGDPLDAQSAGRSGLRYDEPAQAYAFTWKTPATAGCYVLAVTLDSGQALTADFRLS